MTVPESDRRRLEEALADRTFLEAALAEGGMPISAGGPPVPPTEEELRLFEAAKAEADRRFMEAALAEDGMPISAGWRSQPEQPPARPPTAERTADAGSEPAGGPESITPPGEPANGKGSRPPARRGGRPGS